MRHGSLFSGIGGFDLAAEWMGWENVFHCEWNEFGQRVLKHYWPKAESFSDITKTDFTKYEGTIDVISGGFPCQPYSTAGKRKGKNDERHLWPEMLRAIREIKPRFVVGENVRGLTNWNGGLVFDEVCAELEAIGYQVAPVIIPACAVNAPHRRERIWFVAYSNSARFQKARTEQQTTGIEQHRKLDWNVADTSSIGLCQHRERQRLFSATLGTSVGMGKQNVANTNGTNHKAQSQKRILGKENQGRKTTGFIYGDSRTQWNEFPTQSPICGGDDGIPTKLDGITFPKWRAESIKGYGNAIVPQVAYEIFKAIIFTVNSPHGTGETTQRAAAVGNKRN